MLTQTLGFRTEKHVEQLSSVPFRQLYFCTAQLFSLHFNNIFTNFTITNSFCPFIECHINCFIAVCYHYKWYNNLHRLQVKTQGIVRKVSLMLISSSIAWSSDFGTAATEEFLRDCRVPEVHAITSRDSQKLPSSTSPCTSHFL